MKIDPKVTFVLGIITTICLAIGQGTIHLTNLVPMDSIPYITSWAGAISTINSIILTALAGYSSNRSGPLAPPPTVAEAHDIMKEATKGT